MKRKSNRILCSTVKWKLPAVIASATGGERRLSSGDKGLDIGSGAASQVCTPVQ